MRTVAVAGADALARDRLASLLRRDGVSLTGEAASLDELRVECAGDTPTVVVIASDDAHAQPALASAARRHFPDARIVMVSASVERRDVRRLFEAGVDGLIAEPATEATLSAVVWAVMAGQLSMPSECRSLFERPALSPREKQIMAMVVMGFSNDEIAAKLFLTKSTIKSHLASAFTKLSVRSRNDCARFIPTLAGRM